MKRKTPLVVRAIVTPIMLIGGAAIGLVLSAGYPMHMVFAISACTLASGLLCYFMFWTSKTN